MAKSIFEDAKKWPELQEASDELQGIYRPLYYAVKAVEEAVKVEVAKAEPPPQPKPAPKFAGSSLSENSRLARIALAAEKADPSLKGLLIYQDSVTQLDIVLYLPLCPFCKQRHQHAIKLIDYYRSPTGIEAIKAGIDVLKNMCLIELGPAGAQK